MLNGTYDLFLRTIANKTRLKILTSLLGGPKNVGELTSDTRFDQTTISHNLARLRSCGLITSKREGKFRIYSIRGEALGPFSQLVNMRTLCQCERRAPRRGERADIEFGARRLYR